MSEMEQMLRISFKNRDKIRKICEPLYDFFGVNHFCYSCTKPNGKVFCIGSHSNLHEYYFYENLFQCSPFYKQTDQITPGVYFYRDFEGKEFQDSLRVCEKNINVELNAGIVSVNDNALVRFAYGTPPEHAKAFRRKIFSHISMLNKFNAFFVEEAAKILSHSPDCSIDLPRMIGENVVTSQTIISEDSLAHRKKYLSDLGFKDMVEKAEKLSARERECMKLLIEDRSAKETASTLGLSPRTVEFYFENIKNKLSCWSKHEVLQYARLFHELGLL